jgi:O-6-methylguanine DNA methyltransferase
MVTRSAYARLSMPIGDMLVAGTDEGVCALIIVEHAGMPGALEALRAYCPDAPLVPDAETLADVTNQLIEYLNGTRQTFGVPLALRGTPFQRLVWDALLAIPYGETLTYREIAFALGRPGGSQAVGGAVARNPVSIIVPCHRVLGSDGSLTGYMWGTHVKRWLLDHERRYSGQQVAGSGRYQYALPI